MRQNEESRVVDKPGKGSFCATDLDLMLRLRGINTIVLTGIATDVRVHYHDAGGQRPRLECLLLEDCCAATDKSNHDHAIKMLKMQAACSAQYPILRR
jgi:biuret amidohydrolase